MQSALPTAGYLRLNQIIGDRRKDIPALIPISRSSWWKGVAEGRHPKGVKLGPNTTAWKVEDIRELIQRLGAK